MRRTLLVIAALSGCLLADDAERKHSISLDVKVVRSGSSTERSQSTNHDRVSTVRSTKTIVFQRQKSGLLDLELSLQNFAQVPDVVTLDWLFFAQDVNTSFLSVLTEGAEEVVLKPGGRAKVIASAERALSTESKRWQIDRIETPVARMEAPVSHESARAGTKIVGWLARACADGKVLSYKASSPRFEIYADGEPRHELIEKSAGRVGGGFVR